MPCVAECHRCRILSRNRRKTLVQQFSATAAKSHRHDLTTRYRSRTGEGPAVVLLHGLTATRRYVVQGSRQLLGADTASSPTTPGATATRTRRRTRPPTSTTRWSGDLERVLEEKGLERPVLVGSSMGAHVATAFALAHPDARGGARADHARPTWATAARARGARALGSLAEALEAGDVEAFVAISNTRELPERWREASRRGCASGSTATGTCARWRRPAGRAALERLAGARAARGPRGAHPRGGEPRRGGPGSSVLHRARTTRGGCPGRGAGRGGPRRPAARVAGRPAVAPDRATSSSACCGGRGPLRRRAPTRSDDRGALGGRHLVVLRRAHRQPRQPMLGRQLGQPGEVAAGCPRGAP